MREIKTRAWHTSKRIMYLPPELEQDDMTVSANGKGFLNVSGVHPKFTQQMPWLIPMQYIGRRDQNNKEIYEGDIVPTQWGNAIITWADNFAGFYAKRGGTYIALTEFQSEVIGNIYETPELVEKE